MGITHSPGQSIRISKLFKSVPGTATLLCPSICLRTFQLVLIVTWFHYDIFNTKKPLIITLKLEKVNYTELVVTKFGNNQWRIQLHSPEHCRNGKIFTKGTVIIHLSWGFAKLSDSNIVLAFTLRSQKCRVQSSPRLGVSNFIVLVWNKINSINSGQFQ